MCVCVGDYFLDFGFCFFGGMYLYRSLRGCSYGSRGFPRGPDDGHNHRQGAASSTICDVQRTFAHGAVRVCGKGGASCRHPIARRYRSAVGMLVRSTVTPHA